jgi:hypothetical protein
MKIDRVVVFSSARDYYLAEICVTSVRKWNKNIPLFLHKDESRRTFDSKLLEKTMNVQLCDSSRSSMGSPLSKLFYITCGADLRSGENLLILDADTAWFGDVSKYFNSCNGDICVQGELDPPNHWIDKNYFSTQFFIQHNPHTPLPNIVFNTGHFAYRTGTLTLEDFQEVLEFNTESRSYSTKSFVHLWDQGAINYVVARKTAFESVKLEHVEFAHWSRSSPDFSGIDKNPFVIHWAGTAHPLLAKMDHSEKLIELRNEYIRSVDRLFDVISLKLTDARRRIVFFAEQLRLRLLGKKDFYR